jgi:feruloyl esterase
MRIIAGGVCALFFTFAANAQTLEPKASCESLASLRLPETAITAAQPVASGAFKLPGPAAAAAAQTFSTLPAFCRVAATLNPTSDSDIKIEVWLPASGWNGKFQAVGNGGWAGTISYSAMAEALRRGYLTTSTDFEATALGRAICAQSSGSSTSRTDPNTR